ncbi:hypothetical protein, conserved [Babesia ovata]|uniref:Extracellular matrix-binding ebh n=1 Tax=Babesia ovata TaxID=189622 RepID=A0A2H6KJY1_9APIC|nr:uncharacterized protein BOVATA_047900 [Babesia ovata]GBE63297.1 hypothetical protein, conserved [Babesia ovata]
MSFLHGVLDNIKPKLGLHSHHINEAVSLLEANKHSGKDGFNTAIKAVVKGVKGYNEGVKKSNQEVKSAVEALQNKDKFDERTKQKMEHSAQEIKSAETLIGGKLEDCEINASAFVDSLSRHSETIDNFNNTLCNRVRGVISSVEHEKVRLHDVAAKEKDILTAATDKIGDALNKLKCSVNDKIKVDVGKLVKEVKEALKPILADLKNIGNLLKGYINDLTEWIAKAEKAVEESFKLVQEILDAVREDSTFNNVKDIKGAAQKITQKAEQLQGIATFGKTEVDTLVKKALTAVKAMDGQLKQDLFGVRGEIKSKVDAITERIGALYGVVKYGDVNGVGGEQKLIAEVMKTILTKVAEIKNPPNGLEGIVGDQGTYNTNIVTPLTQLNSKALELTKEFIDAQAAELEEKIERQLESMPADIHAQHNSDFGRFKSEIAELKIQSNLQLSISGEQNIEHRQSQIEARKLRLSEVRRSIVSAINSANDAWQRKIHAVLSPLHSKVNTIQTLQATDVKSVLDTVCQQINELIKLAKCVSDEQWKGARTDWNNFKQYVDPLKLQVDQYVEEYRQSGNQHVRYAAQLSQQLSSELVRQVHGVVPGAYQCANRISGHLQGVIASQKANQPQSHGRGLPTWPQQHYRSAYGGYNSYAGGQYQPYAQQLSLTDANNAPTLETLLKNFETQVKEQLKTLTTNVGLKAEPGSVHAQLDAVKKNVDDLNSKLDTASNSAPQPGTAQAVDDAITQVTTTLDAQLPDGDGEKVSIKNATGNSFPLYKTHVKQENIDSLSGDNIEQLAGALPDKIKEIRTQVTGTLSGIDPLKSAIDTSVREITTKFSELCEKVRRAAAAGEDKGQVDDTLRGRLNDLKQKIGLNNSKEGTLKKLLQQLDELHTSLVKGPIFKLNHFLDTHADKMLDVHVKSLHKQVTNTVEDTKALLTTQAKKDYVTAMQLLIQQFAERVRSDLNGLPQAISDDLEQGHKGFMAKLHEQFLNRFNTYLRTYNLESRTLRDIAGTVCYQFSDFMEALYKQEDFTNNRIYVEPSRKALQTLLTHLANSQHFDRIFTDNLKNLRGTFNYFAPKRFHTPNSTLIDPLREGIRSLAKEVGYGYVNTYSGEKPIDGWVTKVTDAKASEPKTKLTDEGKNCAKVCLTVFYTLNSTLQEMKQNCGSNWRGDSVTKSTKLGQFLADQGYDVSDAGKQNGEIDMELRGGQVNKFLVGSDNKHVYKADGTISTLTTLYDYLETYNHACHLRHVDGAKAPLSVFHMLSWLAGLTYSPMLGAMYDRFISLFDKPTEYKAHNHSANYTLDAYPSTITAEQMETSLYDIMSQSHDLLTSILGHGHAGGIYACDHLNNSNNLLYPNNPGACFDLLAEILQRLSQQLSFLYYQCTYPMELGGWSDCHYGRNVSGYHWQCNTTQCPDQTCNQSTNQNGNQRANQKGDQPFLLRRRVAWVYATSIQQNRLPNFLSDA